jgi:hypothetical protein
MTYVVTGSCAEVCPTAAAVAGSTLLGTDSAGHTKDNADFFAVPLPGRDVAFGNPGGACAWPSSRGRLSPRPSQIRT